MKTYIVKYDFTKCQPTWVGDYVRLFGDSNQGIETNALSERDAIEKVAKAIKYNPFYLTAKEKP